MARAVYRCEHYPTRLCTKPIEIARHDIARLEEHKMLWHGGTHVTIARQNGLKNPPSIIDAIRDLEVGILQLRLLLLNLLQKASLVERTGRVLEQALHFGRVGLAESRLRLKVVEEQKALQRSFHVYR